MIRLVCFLVIFLFVPPAFSKTLTKIPTSQVGDTVTTIAGKASGGSSLLDAVVETTIAINKSGALKTAINGAALTIPLIAKRAVPLLGTAYTLGYAADCVFNLANVYDNGWLDNYPILKSIVDEMFPSAPAQGDNLNGLNVACNPSIAACTPGKVAHMVLVSDIAKAIQYGTTVAMLQSYLDTVITPVTNGYGTNGTHYNYQGNVYTQSYNARLVSGLAYADQRTYNVTYLTGSPTGATLPDTLTPDQAQTLGQRIVNAALSNPAIKAAIDSLAVAHPNVVTTPTPITQQDINNWATTNNYNTNQTYIDYLTNLKNTYEGDSTWIDQEIAKAQAEQEKEQAEDAKDTFDPITSSAFDPPYNPGEFDIPARFTSFLHNVKSSGLFSFSTSFFNSLPGGGSPLLTVNGGQTFGTHIFDFSLALGGGLTILKSVLLALFGFLSIRAVIMKR